MDRRARPPRQRHSRARAPRVIRASARIIYRKNGSPWAAILVCNAYLHYDGVRFSSCGIIVQIGMMKYASGRQIGEQLRPILKQLQALAKEARTACDPDAEALEIAVVNLDSAIEILTE